jgi:tRNA1(Val) A37 N6-methylase TrmN6
MFLYLYKNDIFSLLRTYIKRVMEIHKQIKNIELCHVEKDYDELKQMGVDLKKGTAKVSDRCRVGNNIVDYFTFEERLRTKGKYDINFYEFVERIDEFSKKKFIQNMLLYYENVKNKNKTKNRSIVLKEVYNICISAINIFRPLVAMEIYAKYNPSCVLDPCAGWGGRGIGAAALNVPRYIGVEINHGLQEGYAQMADFLSARSETQIDMRFQDALSIDYSTIPPYDMVFTSPPYYFLEKYPNNKAYKNKEAMNEEFYIPLFKKTYEHLQPNGTFVLNVNKEIYEAVCVPLFGEALEILPLKKSKRQNEYGENIYVWRRIG